MISGHASNFEPFAPRGWGNPLSSSGTGMLGAAASIFFAYVGFDAVSTAAEETKNPQRNVPIGLIGSLLHLHGLLSAGRRRRDRRLSAPSRSSTPRRASPSRKVRPSSTPRPPARSPTRLLVCSKEALAHVLRQVVEPAVRQPRRPRGGAGAAVGRAADDVRPDPHLLRHGARRPAARAALSKVHPRVPHAVHRHHRHRRRRRHRGGLPAGRHARRLFERRHLVRLRRGLARR